MEMYPLGVRRDGSYYTRIEWASHTESDPTFWVVNLIRDDLERNGGTWGANTPGPATAVLSFFGESQKISKIRIFRNVGLDISILEELAKASPEIYSKLSNFDFSESDEIPFVTLFGDCRNQLVFSGSTCPTVWWNRLCMGHCHSVVGRTGNYHESLLPL